MDQDKTDRRKFISTLAAGAMAGAAGGATPAAGEESALSQLEARSRERMRQKRLVHDSEGAVLVGLIIRHIAELEERIEAFFDRGHGGRCACAFCSTPAVGSTVGRLAARDLRGLAYNLVGPRDLLDTGLTPDEEDLDELAKRHGL